MRLFILNPYFHGNNKELFSIRCSDGSGGLTGGWGGRTVGDEEIVGRVGDGLARGACRGVPHS